MPRNGLGQYNLPTGNPVVPNTSISSNWANTTLTDLANALSTSLAVDGQTVPTANLPMAGFRHTNVANAQNRTDYASAGQVQDAALTALSAVAGSDTITASLVPAPAGYVVGARYVFTPAANNATTTPTLNINGYGAKPMVDGAGAALPIGALVAGVPYEVYFDGTSFRVGGYGMTVNAQSKANSAAATANAALPLIGGTLTGQTSISGAAATNRQFGWQTATVARWFAGADSSAESGSNAGSNWFLSRFSDAGTFIDSPITVSRATGVASFTMRPSFGAYTPWDSGNLPAPASLSGAGFTGVVSLANLDNPLLFGRSASGSYSYAEFSVAGVARWSIGKNSSAETGSNVGSDFFIQAYADSGASTFTALNIARSTGVVSFSARPVFNGATPWDSGNLPNPQTALGYTPAHADGSYSWTSIWTGNSPTINLYTNFGFGIYMIQIGSGAGRMIMICTSDGGSVTPATGLVAAGDNYNGTTGSAAIQIWRFTKG